jgi:hypothetical protein
VAVPHLPSDEPADRDVPDIDGIVDEILHDRDRPAPTAALGASTADLRR